MKKMKFSLLVIYTFILLVLIVCFRLLDKYLNNNYKDIEKETNELINYKIDTSFNYKETIDKLQSQYNNKDIIGILKIKNANYSMPIVQTNNNDFYLNHNLYKEKNVAGAAFLDYRTNINSSKKLIIYGHNSLSIKAPFNILEKFYDKSFYDNNKKIELVTDTTKKVYEVFSVYVETIDFSYMNLDFDNDDEYLTHINKLKNRSIYDEEIELTSNDEILILQTCSSLKKYRNYEKKYLLIILRRVLNEEI